MRLSHILDLLSAVETLERSNPWERATEYGRALGRLTCAAIKVRSHIGHLEIPITVSTRALAQDRDEDAPDWTNSRRDSPPRADGNPF